VLPKNLLKSIDGRTVAQVSDAIMQLSHRRLSVLWNCRKIVLDFGTSLAAHSSKPSMRGKEQEKKKFPARSPLFQARHAWKKARKEEIPRPQPTLPSPACGEKSKKRNNSPSEAQFSRTRGVHPSWFHTIKTDHACFAAAHPAFHK
ncbi:MAG: hypothetical protein IJ773_13300, partial [Lachnospiraceae bacterium]|nr:hypothetical protein [Lachnospiraceae bacterium]